MPVTSQTSRWRVLLLVSALVAVALAATPARATHGGSPSPELVFVGQWENDDPLADFGAENITDVWAYGNYAYLGTFDELLCTLDSTGVHIIDISNPADPTKVGFIPAPPGTRNNDVKVAHIETPRFTGEILVATNEPCSSPFLPRLAAAGAGLIPGQGGISIWDVTDPTKPRVLKKKFLKNPIHNTYIWEDGGSAYLIAVDDVAFDDVIIVDITRPQAPKVIARTGAPDWPGDIADEFVAPGVFLHDVWVQGGVAYLSYWDAGLVLLDVSDPANPGFLGDSEYIDLDPLSGEVPEGNSHVAVPNLTGTRVLMGDEDFAAGLLTKFEFDGTPYDALEALFTPPVFTLPGAAYSDPVHWTGGEGCSDGEFDRDAIGDEVALIQRGSCFFSTKAANAEARGYTGFVVANNVGDDLVLMSAGTVDVITIPGFFVGQSTGEIMKAGEGLLLDTEGTFDGYGYLRLLDVSTPASIVELDQFATESVFIDPPLPGDRTMHNVVVDEGTTAYISWYAEGLRVVDFSGDTLTEIAHYVDTTDGSNFWGVYLHDHPIGCSFILGSDRSTGLWIFEDPNDPGCLD